MSSPASRLRKLKRSPLPEARRVPFRLTAADPLRDITPHVSRESTRRPASRDLYHDIDTRRSVVEGIMSPSQGGGGSRRRAREVQRDDGSEGASSGAPTDSELLGSMAARLALVERELLATKREIIQKEAKIRELEQRLSALVHPPPSSPELVRKCTALQTQVQEMEEFLSDYGMVWVGSGGSEEDKGHSQGVWLPDSSVPHRPLAVDFDLLVRNIKSLNVLAGAGSVAITNTPRGAKLKGIDAVPLTLYANGMVMFQGPFRPFTDPHTQQCIQDLQDGYFPTELQSQYHNGVPFQLNDQREVTFVPRGSNQIFPGSGQKLGGQRGPSKLCSGSPPSHTTSELPGPKLSVEQFLSRVPATVVRGGRVLDVRSQISDTLLGSSRFSGCLVSLVDTPALDSIRTSPEPPPSSPSTSSPSPSSPSPSPSSPSPSFTTLKVRSESGDHTYVLRMRSTDTIADVWSYLLRQTSSDRHRELKSQARSTRVAELSTGLTRSGYQLVSGVTHQVYSDLSATLLACSLTPNATLHISKTASHADCHTSHTSHADCHTSHTSHTAHHTCHTSHTAHHSSHASHTASHTAIKPT